MEEVNCILCGSNEKDILCLKGRFNENVRTVICKNCSFVYTSPRMDINELRNYYTEKYSKNYKKEENIENINLKNEKRFKFLNENFSLKEGMSILDAGCGKGFWLKYLKEKNLDVEGIEPNYDYYKFASEMLKLNVVNDYIENFNFEKKYDLISMFHLLEHLLNPASVLEALKKNLKKDGLLYIEVPDIFRNPGYDFKENFFRAVHFYNFSYFTLKMFLNKFGFKIIAKDPDYNNLRVLAKPDPNVNILTSEKKEIKREIKKIKNHFFCWNYIVIKNKIVLYLKKNIKRTLKNLMI